MLLSASITLVAITPALAAATCTFTGRNGNILSIALDDIPTVTFRIVAGKFQTSLGIAGCEDKTFGTEVAGLSVLGSTASDFLTFEDAGNSLWALPNGISIDLGEGDGISPQGVALQGVQDTYDIDTIDAGAFATYAGADFVEVAGYGGDDTLIGAKGQHNRLLGYEGNDTLTGGGLADDICGNDGDDAIDGLGGDDLILDGAGADTVLGGPGNDILSQASCPPANETFGDGDTGDTDVLLDGGRGSDTISYAGYQERTSAVTVNLGAGIGGATAESDPLTSIENIRGSDANAQDILVGDDGPNVIEGGYGGDSMTGAGGIDTLSYEHTSFLNIFQPVSVDLGLSPYSGGDAQEDTAVGFENIIGSIYGDNLTGDGNANVIRGGPPGSGMASDTISGGGGDDTIYGSPGTDTLNGDAGKDVVYGGDADDNLFGGAGADKLYGEAGNDTLDGGTERDLANGGADTDACTAERVVACEP